MSSVRFTRVSFAYDAGAPLLSDLSFELHRCFVGVVGANGAGKSTLARLACGALTPSSGVVVRTPALARVALCAQSNETLSDDVRALAEATSHRALRLMGDLELDPRALLRFHTLSSGERRRWQLASALASEADILVVDEPTNHLDDAARAVVVRGLKNHRGLALVISHDRALLQALTTSTLRVHAGTATLYDAPYDDARRMWKAASESLRRTRCELLKKREALDASARSARATHESAERSTSARARMKNKNDHDARGLGAQFRADRAAQKTARAVHVRERALLTLDARIPDVVIDRTSGRAVRFAPVDVRRTRLVSLTLDELRAGERVLARDVHVWLDRGARVHVRGANGAGKTTLLHTLLAHIDEKTRADVLFVPQEIDDASTRALGAHLRELPRETRGTIMTLLAALGSDPTVVVGSALPSPGERKKLALALGLARGVHTLVLDEPTNHLDLPSVENLERALVDFTGTLVLVSHDDTFAARVTDRTWLIDDGRVLPV